MSASLEVIRRFLGAIQFLTIIPVRLQTAPPGESAVFFPLVGAALAMIAASWLAILGQYIPPSLAAAILLAAITLITGGLHEDGLADVADALRASRTADRMFGILKDSRVGAHGALALIFVVLIRWQALTANAADPMASLVVSLSLGRAVMVILLWITPSAGTGAARHFAASLNSWTAAIVLAQGLLIPVLFGGLTGLLALTCATALSALLRAWFVARIGGVNGDCIGAAGLLAETAALVVFAARPALP